MTDLLVQQRQDRIRQQLELEGRVLAADLARTFLVSEDTIRRDLRDMAAAGLCQRVYGGALPANATGAPFAERVLADPERKRALAKEAATLIAPGSTLFIDAGSTNLAIAAAIPDHAGLTVATNTPLIAAALMEKQDVQIILVGGQINRRVGAAVCTKALADIERLNPDLCILGACGVERDAGISAHDFEDASFKRAVALRSSTLIVAATNEKFGLRAPFGVVPLARCRHLIVEADAPEDETLAIAALGVDVRRARAS
ncbi:DeoR/GlpR family DNA-binding transcription regulator [Ensifer soli]|uniref:DeoR/GlpR family DNA-binding transcription regulator n=1 Tax=Ciceribacter sp. sgz301302 TaxID=3342379 RepID=UPI0035B83623